MLQAPGTVEDVDVLVLMMLVIKAPKNRRVGQLDWADAIFEARIHQ